MGTPAPRPWWGLKRNDLWVGAACLALLLMRLATLPLSSFGHYHGINEAHYSLVAIGYERHPLEPRNVDDTPYFDTPALPSYLVFASISTFGKSEFSSRLPSLLMEIPALLGVFFLARKLHGDVGARWATMLFATLPWTVLWFGRAQTDAYVTGFLALAAALVVHGRDRTWTLPLAGASFVLALASKQVALFFVPATVFWIVSRPWPRDERRAFLQRGAAWTLLAAFPILLYYLLQIADEGSALVDAHLRRDVDPFANADRTLGLGLLVGANVALVAAAAWGVRHDPARRGSLPLWSAGLMLAFILWAAPRHHEYYTLALLPFLVVLAVGPLIAWLHHPDPRRRQWARPCAVVVIAGSLAASILLLGVAGDLGDTSNRQAGDATQGFLDAHRREPTVLVAPYELALPLTFYLRDDERANRVVVQTVGQKEVPVDYDFSPLFGNYTHVLVASSTPRTDGTLLGGGSYGFAFVETATWVYELSPGPP